MRTLVRFARSHSDDDGYVRDRVDQGDVTPEHYFAQLMDELVEQGFALGMTMAKFDDRPAGADNDTYYIYAFIADAPPIADLVTMLQHCYDEGAAGFFEIILEGLPEVIDEVSERLATLRARQDVQEASEPEPGKFEVVDDVGSGCDGTFDEVTAWLDAGLESA